MQLAARDMQVLGGEMAAATERLSDTVHGSRQALVLLTQVLQRLHWVLAHTQSQGEQSGRSHRSRGGPEAGSPTPAEVRREGEEEET